MDNLGYIDFILLALIIFAGVRGFLSGFIRELSGLLSLIVGVVFASRYAFDAGEWIRAKISPLESTTFATLLGFVAILLFVWVLFLILRFVFAYFALSLFPNYLNRLLGVLFGLLKAFIALAVLLHLVFRIEFVRDRLLEHFTTHSMFYSGMEVVASKIVGANILRSIPKSPEEIQEKLEEIKDKVQETKDEVVEQLKESFNSKEDSSPKESPDLREEDKGAQ